MGYDVHITRARSWPDGAGRPITRDEWRDTIRSDGELVSVGDPGSDAAEWKSARFEWREGNITAKNLTPEAIDKMVAIARRLGGTVQGDDGETYEGGGRPPRPYRPTLWERIAGWFGAVARPVIHAAPAAFRVGERVVDAFGNAGTVTAVEAAAENGLGRVEVRRDDGTTVTWCAASSGLRRVE